MLHPSSHLPSVSASQKLPKHTDKNREFGGDREPLQTAPARPSILVNHARRWPKTKTRGIVPESAPSNSEMGLRSGPAMLSTHPFAETRRHHTALLHVLLPCPQGENRGEPVSSATLRWETTWNRQAAGAEEAYRKVELSRDNFRLVRLSIIILDSNVSFSFYVTRHYYFVSVWNCRQFSE